MPGKRSATGQNSLLLRLSNHFATQTAVVVFPHAVEVSVVQVALHVPFIIHRTGIAGEWTFGDRGISPRLRHVEAFIDHAVADHD